MGFKLGTSRTPFADRGEIKRKLMFKKDRDDTHDRYENIS